MNKNSFNFAPVKPRDEKKIEMIFDATLRLVKTYGLAGITMSMIAKEAKLATGTVYLYFTNKEELIARLFEVCADNYAKAYVVDVQPKEGYKITFRKIWMNIANHNYQHFDQMIMLEQCFHSPFISDESRVLAKAKLKPWIQFIERGKKEGRLKAMDTIWLLMYIRGTIREMIKQCSYSHKKFSPLLADTMFAMCWDGIAI